MHSIGISSRRWKIGATMFAFMVGILMTIPLPAAQAAKAVVAEAVVTFAGPNPTLLPAGDDKSHMVGLGQRKGKAVFKDGRVGQYGNVFFMDWYRGKTIVLWGYTKIAFKDGSWFAFKWDSQFAGLDQAGKAKYKGAGKIINGSGAYAGIKGTLKYTNKKVGPSKDFPKGATQAQVVMTYTLP